MTNINSGITPLDGVTKDDASAKLNAIRSGVTNALDTLSPAFAPLAQRWDAEADRRMALRTPENLKGLISAQREHRSASSTAAGAKASRRAAREGNRNPLATERRSAARADRAARGHKHQTRVELKKARRSYPETLAKRAVQFHAAHAVPVATATYVMSTPADWTTWPALTSAGLIAANAVALWLGRREVRAELGDDGATAEERALMERLDPSYWVQHADERGLSGTVTTPPSITGAGVECSVRLDGTWTVKTLADKADSIRALLGARTALRVRVSAGSRGGWARITIRTRQAVVADSLLWTPDCVGVGLDLETGDPVVIPIEGTHKGIAAATNMGKSTFWRPWMMEAVANPLMAGVLLDPKRQEARQWYGKIRTEGHQKDGDIRQHIYDGVCELEREMRHRQSIAEVTQWVPTEEYPILLVVIEEMANIVRMAKQAQWKDVLDKLDGLFSEARASGIWFIWATQFPSRSGGGITPQIAENTLATVALTTEGSTADAVIFGNDGPGKGWKPSELGGIPGRALIKYRTRPANPIQGWYVTDETIRALPEVEVWRHKATAPDDTPRGTPLTLVKGDPDSTPTVTIPVQAAPEDKRAEVLEFRRRNPEASYGEISKATGVPKATVSRWITKAEESA